MTEFILGLILGAVFGVVADRIWERFERRPRLYMTVGYFSKRDGEEGLTYKVRNVGSAEIPDFQITLWHPNRGSIAPFNAEQMGPLLPDQTREFRCTLHANGKPNPFLANWISEEKDRLVQSPRFDGFKLFVKMQNSEKIFFQSDKMGNAIANDWYRSLVLNKPGRATWEEHKLMNSPPPIGIKFWLERRRQKKQQDEIVARHKSPDKKPMNPSGGSSVF